VEHLLIIRLVLFEHKVFSRQKTLLPYVFPSGANLKILSLL
jgi:hypothetical protein